MEFLLDFILHIDQYMIDIVQRISYLGLCHTVYNHFLRNGIGCHSIPPRRFFAFCRGSYFGFARYAFGG